MSVTDAEKREFKKKTLFKELTRLETVQIQYASILGKGKALNGILAYCIIKL